MSSSTKSPSTVANVNSWLEDEFRQQYQHGAKLESAEWETYFKQNGAAASNGETHAPADAAPAPAAGPEVDEPAPTPSIAQVQMANVAPEAQPVAADVPASSTAITPAPPKEARSGQQLMPLKGVAARIAENMVASLAVPTATTFRPVSVKLLDENRRLMNEHRALAGKSKISYTHIIAYALVRAVEKVPSLNTSFTEKDGQPFRVVHAGVNIGLAIDVAGKDGNRSLMVPNVKNANEMSFDQFMAAYDDIVRRARVAKLQVPDFEGTTISLTNPGTVGTVTSVPRLMPGQGAIIATGAIDFPPEYRGMSEQMRAALGLTKIMGVTCTYDHRVIQGAESGVFLARVEELLDGADHFYEGIFASLRIPFLPLKLSGNSPSTSLLPGFVAAAAVPQSADVGKELAVYGLIHHYRVRGHLLAHLDPLGSEAHYHPELDPATYGITLWDYDRPFAAGAMLGGGRPAELRSILETLRKTYCSRIGCEYMHIQGPEEKQWLQKRMEPTCNLWDLGAPVQKRIAERLIETEEFERFLDNRFKGHKRFSIEGGESAIAILDEVLDRAANHRVSEAVIGMAHRGRLAVLANIVGKSLQQLFSAFDGDIDPESSHGSGDVKYHLGATGVRRSSEGREITVSVAFNPSHLEAVDPVVQGLVRPKQDRLGDTKRERVLPILIHGDAAFAGQGVVSETLNLSQLEGYSTGGTIHLVINNQIGFTTNPVESRSMTYCTDVARMVQAPIFHVNGDDPEACVRVAQLAYDYRQQFKKDVVIDMVCYRKHGHNEADDPSYTQPLMYQKIRAQQPVTKQYTERLIREKVLTAGELEVIQKRVLEKLNFVYDETQRNKEDLEWHDAPVEVSAHKTRPHTTIDGVLMEVVLNGITTFPADFTVHPKLKGFLDKRRDLIDQIPAGEGAVDWALGEALAFGSLVLEGTSVRLSGQDSGRGTFSQRHLEFYDYERGILWVPMQHLAQQQGRFEVWDSSLSEFAVMGFEFGYSVADPLALVMWEGQFGDFVNGAQVVIDQFISSAESKWAQPSGLVLLLPHGYEGQGPEHSSARIERFLRLCAENNMQVANCTTPAQYFHLLRRQVYGGQDRRGVRKPLIIFTPKGNLRLAKASSPLKDFMTGGFHEILSDTTDLDIGRVSRVLVCSGKVYYDLAAEREKRGVRDIAIVRIEQLYPFAVEDFSAILSRYPWTAEVCWVQEEPRNMGPWQFMQDQIQPLLESTRRSLRYVGRTEAASPAAGSLKRHQHEQSEMLEEAFAPKTVVRRRRVPVRIKKVKK